MNIKLLLTIALSILLITTRAQVITDLPFIEISGTAEMEVTPDEIFIVFAIAERTEGREQISIETQVHQLIEALKTKGIDVSTFSLAHQDSQYEPVKWSRKDIVSNADYQLMVHDATQVGLLFETLDQQKIYDSRISHVSHSRMEELKKEVRINAVKAAKNKAEYMLTAIGETCGDLLLLSENGNHANTMMSSTITLIPGVNNGSQSLFGVKKNPISYKKIKIEQQVSARFQIKRG
jgi:uncharacterized protein YggE